MPSATTHVFLRIASTEICGWGLNCMDKKSLEKALDFAKDVCLEAGELTLRYFRGAYEKHEKDDSSPVTQADLETEQLVRDRIAKAFPDHVVAGEEFGGVELARSAEWAWVVDPIDGTKSFVKGVALYTNLLALLHRGEPVLGVINNPFMKELTWGARGLGAWMNGESIHVSATSQLADAWLMNTDPSDLLRRHGQKAHELLTSVRFTRTWADGYGYALVARGDADICLDPIVSIWDVACLAPIIGEAGGKLTDLRGAGGLGNSALATNGLLHGAVLDILNA